MVSTLGSMKTLLRAIVFLAMLFVFLYVGINNNHQVAFSFPVMQKEKIQATAAVLFFAMFAVGVVAGIALGSGGQKTKAAPESKKKG